MLACLLIHINNIVRLLMPGMLEAPLLDKANQCDSNPCQNDGLCIDGDYQYTCQCLSGYSGYNCERSPPPQQGQLFTILKHFQIFIIHLINLLSVKCIILLINLLSVKCIILLINLMSVSFFPSFPHSLYFVISINI